MTGRNDNCICWDKTGGEARGIAKGTSRKRKKLNKNKNHLISRKDEISRSLGS